MSSRWWSWWKLQASFWIHIGNYTYQNKRKALDSLNNEADTLWKQRANRGMSPKDAVNSYFRFKDGGL